MFKSLYYFTSYSEGSQLSTSASGDDWKTKAEALAKKLQKLQVWADDSIVPVLNK